MYSLYLYFLVVSVYGILLKHWIYSMTMRNEVILLYGIGYKGLVHAISTTKGKEYLHLLSMKPLFKLEIVISAGCGLQSNQFIELYWESTFQMKEICL